MNDFFSKVVGFIFSIPFLIIAVLVIGFGLLFLANKSKSDADLSSATLPVAIDVYVDFNCPHCAEFEPVVKAAREKYGDQVNIQLKNMPFLTSGQTPDTSVEYAYAYIAAKNQGKGNEFAEEIFKWVTYTKSPSGAATIYTYTDEEKSLFTASVDVDVLANYLKLDVAKFDIDKASDETKASMKAEKEAAVKIMGAPSTPAVFMYGKLFKLTTYDEFDAKIDSYIAAAKNKPVSSTTNK